MTACSDLVRPLDHVEHLRILEIVVRRHLVLIKLAVVQVLLHLTGMLANVGVLGVAAQAVVVDEVVALALVAVIRSLVLSVQALLGWHLLLVAKVSDAFDLALLNRPLSALILIGTPKIQRILLHDLPMIVSGAPVADEALEELPLQPAVRHFGLERQRRVALAVVEVGRLELLVRLVVVVKRLHAQRQLNDLLYLACVTVVNVDVHLLAAVEHFSDLLELLASLHLLILGLPHLFLHV